MQNPVLQTTKLCLSAHHKDKTWKRCQHFSCKLVEATKLLQIYNLSWLVVQSSVNQSVISERIDKLLDWCSWPASFYCVFWKLDLILGLKFAFWDSFEKKGMIQQAWRTCDLIVVLSPGAGSCVPGSEVCGLSRLSNIRQYSRAPEIQGWTRSVAKCVALVIGFRPHQPLVFANPKSGKLFCCCSCCCCWEKKKRQEEETWQWRIVRKLADMRDSGVADRFSPKITRWFLSPSSDGALCR